MRARSLVPLLSALVILAVPAVASADDDRNGWLLQAEELPWSHQNPTTTARMTGTVGPGDEMDYFTLTIGSYQDVKLIPDDDPGCPEYSLQGDNGGRLDVNGDEPTRVIVRVRYQYIQCRDKLPDSGRFTYGFTVQTRDRIPSSPIPEAVRESEPNNTLQTANVAENGRWYRGQVRQQDDDYFTFWTPPGVHVYYWQTLGASEEDDGWQAPAFYSFMDSPSLLELLLPNYTTSSTACQNCRFSFYRVSYGPEQVRIYMPGNGEPVSWSFAVSGKPGTMLTRPYDGPVPTDGPRAPAYVPETTRYISRYPAPLTGATIPRLDEISDVYGFGQKLRGELLEPTPAPTPTSPPTSTTATTTAPSPTTTSPATTAAPSTTLTDTAPAAAAQTPPQVGNTTNAANSQPTSVASAGGAEPSRTSRRAKMRCAIEQRSVRKGRSFLVRCARRGTTTVIHVHLTRGGKTLKTTVPLRARTYVATAGIARGRYVVRIRNDTQVVTKRTVTIR